MDTSGLAGHDRDPTESSRCAGLYDVKIQKVRANVTPGNWHNGRKTSDDKMCKRWRDQINTATIFAGVYSSMTILTIQSHRSLEDSARVLAYYRILNRLDLNCDPTVADCAVPTITLFKASPFLVFAKAVYVTSLILSLVTFGVGLLCKQWLYSYERCDTPAAKESGLVRGLPCPGLRKWHVPTVIAFLPALALGAISLSYVGVHFSLWGIQPVVGFFATIGEIILVIGIVVLSRNIARHI